MPEIIVNADDFGLSAAVNRAVATAWREGILTSASIMPGGKAFDEAVSLARENRGLQVGLHLTLVQGKSVLPASEIPGLVNAEGHFGNDAVRAGMSFFFRRELREPLRREIEAQIRKVRDAGIDLTHVDGHLNIHLHPVVFDILMELAPIYGLRTIRLTRERIRPVIGAGGRGLAGILTDAFIFSRLSARSLPALRSRGIGYADEVKGLLLSGRMTERSLVSLLQGPLAGVTEFYFHPSAGECDDVRRWMPSYSHGEELAALTSRKVVNRLRELGVTLRSYRGDVKKYA